MSSQNGRNVAIWYAPRNCKHGRGISRRPECIDLLWFFGHQRLSFVSWTQTNTYIKYLSGIWIQDSLVHQKCVIQAFSIIKFQALMAPISSQQRLRSTCTTVQVLERLMKVLLPSVVTMLNKKSNCFRMVTGTINQIFQQKKRFGIIQLQHTKIFSTSLVFHRRNLIEKKG